MLNFVDLPRIKIRLPFVIITESQSNSSIDSELIFIAGSIPLIPSDYLSKELTRNKGYYILYVDTSVYSPSVRDALFSS